MNNFSNHSALPTSFVSRTMPIESVKKTKAKHDRETSKALRRQFIVWLYGAARNTPMNFQQLDDKCRSLNISRSFNRFVIRTNILVQKNQGYIWNPDITNPNFEELTNLTQNAERLTMTNQNRKRKENKRLLKSSMSLNQSDYLLHEILSIKQDIVKILKHFAIS